MVKAARTAKSGWIDITLPLHDNMLQGSLEPLTPHIELIRRHSKGDPLNLTQININSHNGTHIDSPFHHFSDGMTIDKMPPETTIGPARVIEIKDPVSINPEELEPYHIRRGERILFKTRNSYRPERFTVFFKDLVGLTMESARYLAKKKIRAVGIDYLTIGIINSENDNRNIHNELFNAGIFIIEDLDLTHVEPGNYEMVCLPIRLENGDAGICRAFIRPVK